MGTVCMLTLTASSTGSLEAWQYNQCVYSVVMVTGWTTRCTREGSIPTHSQYGSCNGWINFIFYTWHYHYVYAQGVTGYEGIFRKSCEVTLRLLREQSDPLMWYVKIFSISQGLSYNGS